MAGREKIWYKWQTKGDRIVSDKEQTSCGKEPRLKTENRERKRKRVTTGRVRRKS